MVTMMSDKQTKIPIQIDQSHMLQGTRHYSKVKTCCPSQPQWNTDPGLKEYRRLWLFPEIQRDAFCMGDQTDHCLGGLSSENTAAKNPLGEGLVCLYFYTLYNILLYGSQWEHLKVNWIMLLSCLRTCNDFRGLIKSNLNFSCAHLVPAWSDFCLHCRPCSRSPTMPGPLDRHRSL